MINIANLTLAFGGRVLFENVTLFIDKKDKLGLVGRNGAGKSSLFKLILNEYSAEGDLSIQPGTTIGHLKQELKPMKGLTVFEEAKTAFEEIAKIEANIERINEQLTDVYKRQIQFHSEQSDLLASADHTYIMVNEDTEYHLENTDVYVEVRGLKGTDEGLICTAMGIAYPQIFIEKMEY